MDGQTLQWRTAHDDVLPVDITTNNQRLIWTRWAAGLLVLAATFVCVHVLSLPLPELQLYLLGVVLLAYNAALIVGSRRLCQVDSDGYQGCIRNLLVLQVVLDWTSMAFFVHFTGGVTSPGLVFFFIHAMIVAILLPNRWAYFYAFFSVIVVFLIALLEGLGVLPQYTVIPALPATLHTNVHYVLALLGFQGVALFSVVYFTNITMNKLRERDQRISMLFQTTRDVSSTLDIDDVLERVARSAALALRAPGASIRLLEPNRDNLAMVGSYGLSQQYIDKGPVELASSQVDREALTGRVLIIREPSRDPRVQYPHEMAAEGIRAMLVAPILGRSQPLGVLRVYSDIPDQFTDDDARFVQAIGRQGATAIENAIAHEALQHASEDRARFVRTVTHELRAPVNASRSLLSVMVRGMVGEMSAQQLDFIRRLERRLDELSHLIDDLLALAASQAPPQDSNLTCLPLQAILSQVVAHFEVQAQDNGLTLRFQPLAREFQVKATQEGLERIFDNLIGNAIKYTPEGGSVDVSVVWQQPYVTVNVADTGIGIPEDVLHHIGNEFFRAPNAHRAGISGTGLGMAIVRQLLTHYGGRMGIESHEGEGTTFSLTFPLADCDAEA